MAYRLIEGISIVAPRSFCPACRHPIHWYDNLPLISYLLLRGTCRKCHESISWLYFFIELLTALSFYILFSTVESSYWFAYTLFFSALIVTIRTDLEHMLISRYMSLYLIPIGILCSWAQLLPITLTESILGALFGYGLLWMIRRIFYALRKVEGLGIGDAELLAMIGSFCGPLGVWVSLLIGSLLGTLFALTYLIIKREGNLRSVKIPFGPFLAFGALIFVIFEYELITFFLP